MPWLQYDLSTKEIQTTNSEKVAVNDLAVQGRGQRICGEKISGGSHRINPATDEIEPLP